MTDQRLSERLTMAARAVDTTQPHPVYDARMNALYELVLDVAIPDLQALEARVGEVEAENERLTAALQEIAEAQYGGEYVPATGETAAERAKRALAEPQEAQ